MPSTELTDEDFQDGSIDLITMLVKTGLVPTRSEGRRAIEQGAYLLTVKKLQISNTQFPKMLLERKALC